MANFTPTPQQARAISDQDVDILVSASAGSGKTAVLVDRVIELLKTDPTLNIDQFLLVTFTKEAAKNMRDRIRQRLLNDSVNQHLKAQLARLPLANISTIHAFCEQIIKQYYYVIGLDPKYRLLTDAAEQNLLQEQVWQALEEEWLGQANQQFADLKAAFQTTASNVGEGLAEVVWQLDTVANAQAHPQAWLDQLLENYRCEAAMTTSPFYQTQLQPLVAAALADLAQKLTTLVDAVPPAGPFGKIQTILQADLTRVKDLQAALPTAGWDQLVHAFSQAKFDRWSTAGLKEAADKEAAAALKAQRDTLKDQFTKLGEQYFNVDEAVLLQRVGQARGLLAQLIAVTKEFRQRYQGLKAAQHLVDFSDLEHFAYQILTTETPAGRQAQAQLRHQFREIMVDEYQDTNALQDELVKQLHDPAQNHLFMVGDVKQSIYRFRQADPTLFLARYRRYAGEAAGNEAIDLAENFRSMNSVTDFVNVIFTQLMDETLGELAYDQAAQLKYAATRYEAAADPRPAPELLLYDASATETPDPAVEHYVERQVNDPAAGEVWLIGLRIRQMLDRHETIFDQTTGQMRPIEPRDIAILARTKQLNNQLVEQFARLEIPVVVHDVKNYFKATEVQTMLALLKVIDNPAQDIPLVAVLRSPLVGLTERELALIRLQAVDADYYSALVATQTALAKPDSRAKLAAQWAAWDLSQPSDQGPTPGNFDQFAGKVQRFQKQLTTFQQVAERQSLVALIWQIYQTTDYLDYVAAMPGGSQRQANLHALYQRANEYEQGGMRGLYRFIHFIERMQRRDDDLAQAPGEVVGNAVNVMTIHGSKGLQFPVVFLVNNGHHFNTMTQTAPLVVNPHVGVGMRFSVPVPDDPLTRYRYDLPQRAVVLRSLLYQERAEEMRLLYVALTRAEQRLIITAGTDHEPAQLVAKWQAAATATTQVLPAAVRLQAKSFLDWLGMTLVRTGLLTPATFASEAAWPQTVAVPAQLRCVAQVYTANQLEAALATLKDHRGQAVTTPAETPLTRAQQQFLAQTLQMQYPHLAATKTTAYQSVSALREVFASQDPDEARMGHLSFNQQTVQEEGRYLQGDFGQPSFLAQGPQKPTATAIGTATHLVLAQLALTTGVVTPEQVTSKIDELVANGLIDSPQLGAAIDVAGIVAFYQTPLGQQILAHPRQVRREQPFSMLLNGSDLFTNLQADDGELLIHGIIDGYLTTPAGIELFDYKTDEIDAGDPTPVIERYRGQLNLYAAALHQMTGQPVLHQYLYLVRIGELVEV